MICDRVRRRAQQAAHADIDGRHEPCSSAQCCRAKEHKVREQVGWQDIWIVDEGYMSISCAHGRLERLDWQFGINSPRLVGVRMTFAVHVDATR